MLRLVQDVQRYVQGSGAIILSAAISAGLSAVCVVLSARLLGPEDFGVLGTLLAFISIVTLLLRPVLLATSHVAAVAKSAGHWSIVQGICGRALLMAVPASIVTVCVGIGLAQPLSGWLRTGEGPSLILTGLLVVALAYNQIAIGCALGLGQAKTFNIVTVGEPFVRALLLVPLTMTFGAAGTLAAYFLSLNVASIFATSRVGGVTLHLRTDILPRNLVQVGSGSISLLGAVAIAQYLDIVAVRSYLDPLSVGLYATAATLAGFLFVSGLPLCLNAYPQMVAAIADGRSPFRTLVSNGVVLLMMGTVATVGGAWLAPVVIVHAFGADFEDAATLTPILLARTTANLLMFLFASYSLAVGHYRFALVALVPAILPAVILPFLRLPASEAALLSFEATALSAVATVAITLIGHRARPSPPEKGFPTTD